MTSWDRYSLIPKCPEPVCRPSESGNYTVLWETNLVVILNSAGEVRINYDLGTNVTAITGVCNSSQFAVAVIEEGQYKIKVYDFNEIEVWDNLYTDMSILDIGYFGEKNDQLWTVALDYHGTIPITRITTNYPGSSQTGRITVNDQICYFLEPLEEEVYIVGTHHIQSRTYTDTRLSEIMINGWALQSSYVNEQDDIAFLLAPVDATGTDVPPFRAMVCDIRRRAVQDIHAVGHKARHSD